jgi:hypothetical protein
MKLGRKEEKEETNQAAALFHSVPDPDPDLDPAVHQHWNSHSHSQPQCHDHRRHRQDLQQQRTAVKDQTCRIHPVHPVRPAV